MAPKSMKMAMKGKVKAKGKGKAKGKAKGKLLKLDPSKQAPDAEGNDGEVIAKKVKPPSMRAQVLKQLEENTFQEAMAERKMMGAKLDEQINQQSKMAAQISQRESTAIQSLQEVQADVAAAEETELEAMNKYRAFGATRSGSAKAIEDGRKELMEATRAMAVIEVMAENRKKMQELEQQRCAAQEASEAAKRQLAERKAAEKEALEATRRALQEQKEKALAEKAKAAGVPAEEPQTNGDARKSADLD